MSSKLIFKDKLEILEAVCTICVSVVALWGTVVAGQHNLWHKLRVLIDHYHAEIVRGDLTPP